MGTRATRGSGTRASKPATVSLALVPQNGKEHHLRTKGSDSTTQGIISSVCKMLTGGKKELMVLAALAPEIEPSIATILEDWAKLSSSGRNTVSIDQLCRARKIDPYHFLGVVAEAAIKYRDNASVIVAAMNLPKIVEKSIKFAQKKEGFKDREALMKHGGFLPIPSGNTFVNTLQAKVETNVEQPGSSGHLPSFEATIGAIDVD